MTYQDFLPPSGSKVRLVEPPRGSWARAGEVVRVTYAPNIRGGGKKRIHGQTTVRVWDEERGCGTYDSAMFWRWARFEVVA